MNNSNESSFWLRLDNAAKIYPSAKVRDLTSVFRITAVLEETVKARQFFEAIDAIEDKFPYYKVKLKAGFFWYYLEHHNLPIAVAPDSEIPCKAFNKDELMFRVLVKKNNISVEFSHILTDGTGAFEFLKTILLSYFGKCGVGVLNAVKSNNINKNDQEEFEDAFNRYYKNVKSPRIKMPKAFNIPFRLKKTARFKLLTATLPLNKILAKAKEFDVSLTDYLSAVYIYSLQEIYDQLPKARKRKCNKIIRIQVPVNLRKIFPSETMRNFSLFVMPGIDLRLGNYSFEEIVKTVYHQIQLATDPKLISKNISRNVGGEKNPFIRVMPLFIKSFVLSRLYINNTKNFSGVVTNYGKVDLSPQINEQIKKFIFIPPPPNKLLKINCGVVGFDNKLVMSFGNITVSKELERKFLSFLMAQGIPVKIINR